MPINSLQKKDTFCNGHISFVDYLGFGSAPIMMMELDQLHVISINLKLDYSKPYKDKFVSFKRAKLLLYVYVRSKRNILLVSAVLRLRT